MLHEEERDTIEFNGVIPNGGVDDGRVTQYSEYGDQGAVETKEHSLSSGPWQMVILSRVISHHSEYCIKFIIVLYRKNTSVSIFETHHMDYSFYKWMIPKSLINRALLVFLNRYRCSLAAVLGYKKVKWTKREM